MTDKATALRRLSLMRACITEAEHQLQQGRPVAALGWINQASGNAVLLCETLQHMSDTQEFRACAFGGGE